MKAPAFWDRPTLAGHLLKPLSLLYWMAAASRIRRIVAQALPVPVICIGNNTLGGTGKTPLVIHSCALLQAEGYRPHVISRGYKGTFTGALRVDPARHSAAEVGDEPLLIARQAPCVVARRRIDAAMAAITDGADCLIMDDGLQNPTLKKDLSILVVDGTYGFGNRAMLPAGPCREPVALSLHKADLLMVMGEASHKDVSSLETLHEQVCHGRLCPVTGDPAQWRGRRVFAFAGIGRPAKFFDTLRTLGCEVSGSAAFADHHPYRDAELHRLAQQAAAQEAALMTTAKDHVRLPPVWRERVACLDVRVEIEEEDRFRRALLSALRPREAAA